jgi:hypothetical protein
VYKSCNNMKCYQECRMVKCTTKKIFSSFLKIKLVILWVMTPCKFWDEYQHFSITYWLYMVSKISDYKLISLQRQQQFCQTTYILFEASTKPETWLNTHLPCSGPEWCEHMNKFYGRDKQLQSACEKQATRYEENICCVPSRTWKQPHWFTQDAI